MRLRDAVPHTITDQFELTELKAALVSLDDPEAPLPDGVLLERTIEGLDRLVGAIRLDG